MLTETIFRQQQILYERILWYKIMKKYIIPDWIKQYENDAAPFSIEKIVLKKYEDDWTLFFYSNDDTTGGIVINQSSGTTIAELLDYAEHNHIAIEYSL